MVLVHAFHTKGHEYPRGSSKPLGLDVSAVGCKNASQSCGAAGCGAAGCGAAGCGAAGCLGDAMLVCLPYACLSLLQLGHTCAKGT
jgi:hypothetical protein